MMMRLAHYSLAWVCPHSLASSLLVMVTLTESVPSPLRVESVPSSLVSESGFTPSARTLSLFLQCLSCIIFFSVSSCMLNASRTTLHARSGLGNSCRIRSF